MMQCLAGIGQEQKCRIVRSSDSSKEPSEHNRNKQQEAKKNTQQHRSNKHASGVSKSKQTSDDQY